MGQLIEWGYTGFGGRGSFVVFAMLCAGCATILPDGYDREPAADASAPIAVPQARDGFPDALRSSAPIDGQTIPEDAAAHRFAVWTFTFEYDNVEIRSADLNTAGEISDYIKQNSVLRIDIDGAMNPRGIDPHNRGLRDRRVKVVREALIAVGVPAYVIETGALGSDDRFDRDWSVEVLVRTGK